MSMAIVSPEASSLPPAPALEFRETASACESRSTRLVSRRASSATTLAVPAQWAVCMETLKRPTMWQTCRGDLSACQSQQHLHNLVGVTFRSSGGEKPDIWPRLPVHVLTLDWTGRPLDTYNPISLYRSTPARAGASVQRHKHIDPKCEPANSEDRDECSASSVERGWASMPRVRSLEHRVLQERSLFNSLPPDARQNSPPGYGREHERGKSRKGR
ncbi:unnamed protein product [Pleuronectes platessa]|uniref:Uncharacterized protein n=1 Tax=Pleuronectes platessa TaxID=8262 RepID=A0A9N7Z6W2_PLEPL|nr:unnamed protein product [Pleuronectes platessa]